MSILLSAVAVIVMLSLVVGIHELGHFSVAKWSGIRVDEFSIGFGPRLLHWRRGETDYSVRVLPLGGYVKMPGMSALEDDQGGARGFSKAPAWRRLAVLLAGVTMNLILAGVLLGILQVPGAPSYVVPGSGAAASGLTSGDEITAVANQPVAGRDAVSAALRQADDRTRGGAFPVTYRRADGTTTTVQLEPTLQVDDANADSPLVATDGSPLGQMVVDTINGQPLPAGGGDPAQLLGGGAQVTVTGHLAVADGTVYHVGPTVLTGVVNGAGQTIGQIQAAWRVGYAPSVAGKSVPAAIASGFIGLPGELSSRVGAIWQVLTVTHSGGVANFQGPVGIAHDTATAVNGGWMQYANLVALISLSLAIINVLPIPPFDGGRVAILAVEVIRRRRVAARVEMGFTTVGVVLIATLFLVITVNDIKGF